MMGGGLTLEQVMMRRILPILCLTALTAMAADIYIVPMGTKTNASPWWDTDPMSSVVSNWQAWQTVNSNIFVLYQAITNLGGSLTYKSLGEIKSYVLYDTGNHPILDAGGDNISL